MDMKQQLLQETLEQVITTEEIAAIDHVTGLAQVYNEDLASGLADGTYEEGEPDVNAAAITTASALTSRLRGKEPRRIAVYVEGGNVTAIMANDPTIEVVMVDFDNIEDGDAEPDSLPGLIHEIY